MHEVYNRLKYRLNTVFYAQATDQVVYGPDGAGLSGRFYYIILNSLLKIQEMFVDYRFSTCQYR